MNTERYTTVQVTKKAHLWLKEQAQKAQKSIAEIIDYLIGDDRS